MFDFMGKWTIEHLHKHLSARFAFSPHRPARFLHAVFVLGAVSSRQSLAKCENTPPLRSTIACPRMRRKSMLCANEHCHRSCIEKWRKSNGIPYYGIYSTLDQCRHSTLRMAFGQQNCRTVSMATHTHCAVSSIYSARQSFAKCSSIRRHSIQNGTYHCVVAHDHFEWIATPMRRYFKSTGLNNLIFRFFFWILLSTDESW